MEPPRKRKHQLLDFSPKQPELQSVLNVVVKNGFLGGEQLSRLEQTSVSLKKVCRNDLWKTLCYHNWRETSELEDFITNNTSDGYRGWCIARISRANKKFVHPPLWNHPTLQKMISFL